MNSLIVFLIFALVTFMLIMLSVPLSISLILSSAMVLVFWTEQSLWTLMDKTIGGIDSFTLLAIPFFLIAAEVMEQGDITTRIINVFNSSLGKIKGGLALVNVFVNMFMGGISGSGIADTSATGSVLIPEMKKAGYTGSFSAAITAAAAICGPIIPPSIPLIIYGVVAQESIIKLFMAGYIPGILITLTLAFYVIIMSKTKSFPVGSEQISIANFSKHMRKGIWSLVLPILLVIGILKGVFTVTELGAVLIAYAIIVGVFVHRKLKIKSLPKILLEGALNSANIMFVIGASAIVAYLLVVLDIPLELSDFVLNLTDNKIILLLIVNIAFLIAGMFLDSTPATIILVPIFLPIMNGIGVDPIHFGIIVVFNLMIGLITPPVGLNLLVAANIANTPFWKALKDVFPLLILLLIDLALVTYIPEISLFIPNLFAG